MISCCANFLSCCWDSAPSHDFYSKEEKSPQRMRTQNYHSFEEEASPTQGPEEFCEGYEEAFQQDLPVDNQRDAPPAYEEIFDLELPVKNPSIPIENSKEEPSSPPPPYDPLSSCAFTILDFMKSGEWRIVPIQLRC